MSPDMGVSPQMGMGWIGLLIIGLLIILSIVVIVGLFPTLRRNVRWILAVVAGLYVMATAASLFSLKTVGVRPTSVRAVASVPHSPPMPVLDKDIPFDADVYPSVASAAKAMARAVKKELEATFSPAEGIALTFKVKVTGNADHDVLSQVAGELAGSVEIDPAAATQPSGTIDKNTAIVQVDVAATGEGDRSPTSGKSGTLQIVLRHTAGQTSHSVRFVDKPWVDNFAQFVNQNPSRNWLIAESPQLCTSEKEAFDQAMNNVFQSLPTSHTISTLRTDSAMFKEIIIDRFAQSFNRPYGRVWREVILVDASPDTIWRAWAIEQRSIRTGWLQTGFSLAALSLLTVVAYFFLNLATRGYYVWPVRIAVGVVLAAAILFLVIAG